MFANHLSPTELRSGFNAATATIVPAMHRSHETDVYVVFPAYKPRQLPPSSPPSRVARLCGVRAQHGLGPPPHPHDENMILDFGFGKGAAAAAAPPAPLASAACLCSSSST